MGEEELHIVKEHFPTIEELSTEETYMARVELGTKHFTGVMIQQEAEGKTCALKAVLDTLDRYEIGLIVCVGIAGCLRAQFDILIACINWKRWS